MTRIHLSCLLIIIAACCGCATNKTETYDFPITRSVMEIGKHHEHFNTIKEAYQHNDELIIAYTMNDIPQDAFVEHWVRFEPDWHSNQATVKLSADIVEVGQPTTLILKDFDQIHVLNHGGELPDVHEWSEGEMIVSLQSNYGTFAVSRNVEGYLHSQRFIFPKVDGRSAYAYPVLAIGVPVAVVADVAFYLVMIVLIGMASG